MFLLLSGITCFVALYYLALIYEAYPANTDYLTPLLVLFLFSVASFIREFWKILEEDEPYDYYGHPQDNYFVEDTYDEEWFYSSKARGREKLKELRKSRWFRIKENICGFFGYDIAKKYERVKAPVKKVVKHYPSQYPKSTSSHYKEQVGKEYNAVSKFVNRSFDIKIDKD